MAPPVSVREAQEATLVLGDARTEELVGRGGLSGASVEALRRLIEAAREQTNKEGRVDGST